MPNWCENRLSVSGPKSVIAELVKAVGLERGEFDFNGIVPMPAELHISKGSATSWGEDVLYGDWKRVIDIPWMRERL
jgi:cytochrome c551/c552